jgi:hypothetical protein
MSGVREAPDPRRAWAAQAVVLRPAGGIVYATARCIDVVMRNTSESQMVFVVGRRIENQTVAPRLPHSPSARRP